jgi:hypothetical protein
VNRFGVFLVLLGIAVPLICVAFADHYQPDAGVIKNIQTMDVKLAVGGEKSLMRDIDIFKKAKKFVVPYRYIFAGGVIIVFTGIYSIVINYRKTRRWSNEMEKK